MSETEVLAQDIPVMPLGIAHFAFGAAVTTFVVTYLVPVVWYPRTTAMVGGGWAMLPDAHNVSPVFAAELGHLHYSSPWMDLFWLHRTLDGLDAANSQAFAAITVAAFVAMTLVAERRDDRASSLVLAAYASSMAGGRREDEAS